MTLGRNFVPLRTHSGHPASRASVASAVLGIVMIAAAVMAIVPIALRWPAAWPLAPVDALLAGLGVWLIRRHMARHRA